MNNKPISSLSFPIFIKWYITGKCNIRCQHCYLTDYTYSAPTSKMLEFARYFLRKGVIQFYLLGGEPLMRKDLEDLIKIIKFSERRIGIRIATNGILATEKRARSLVVAGADDFQISLEGASASSHDKVRGKGTFEKAITGVRNLINAKAHITLALTIGKHNIYEIDHLIKLAIDLNVPEVKLAIFVPLGTGLNAENMVLNREDVEQARSIIQNCRLKYKNLKIVSDMDTSDNVKSTGPCFGCGAGTTTLVVNPDFSLSACDLLTEEDRVTLPTCDPNEIDLVWNNGDLFKKWRGHSPCSKTLSISSFENVHQSGCHVVNSLYGEEIGIYKF